MTTTIKTQQDAIQQLGDIAVINLDVSIWSGQTALKPADLELGQGAQLPPETVALLGSKRICSREDLRIFKTLKERARRHVAEHGLPFVGGYAVPVARIPLITSVLDEVMADFEKAKAKFLDNYETAIESWIADNPAYEALIRSGIKPKATVAERITSGYQVFQLSPVAGAETSLASASDGLAGELVNEVRKEAKAFYEKHLKSDQGQVDGRSYATWPPLVKKVQGLTFLDARFDALEKLLVETGNCYPLGAKGSRSRVIGADYHQLRANVLILSTDRIEDYLDGTDSPSAMLGGDDWGSDDDALVVPEAAQETSSADAPAQEIPEPVANAAEAHPSEETAPTQATPEPAASSEAMAPASADAGAEPATPEVSGFDDLEALLEEDFGPSNEPSSAQPAPAAASEPATESVPEVVDQEPVADPLMAELDGVNDVAATEPSSEIRLPAIGEEEEATEEGSEATVARLGTFDPDADDLGDSWF